MILNMSTLPRIDLPGGGESIPCELWQDSDPLLISIALEGGRGGFRKWVAARNPGIEVEPLDLKPRRADLEWLRATGSVEIAEELEAEFGILDACESDAKEPSRGSS